VTKFNNTYSGGNLTGIAAIDPLGRVSNVTFDRVDGFPAAATSASGKAAFFFFDSLGRPQKVKYQDGTQVSSDDYDGNNNLLSMTDGSGTTSFKYNHRNRVIQKSSPQGTVTYTYDGVGNLTSKKDAGGTVTYEYDAVNRLIILTEPGAVVTYDAYDENNMPHTVRYSSNGMTITRDWDGAGRATRIQAGTPAGSLVDLRYQYVPGSNLLHCFTDTDGTIAVYSYDVLNQLTAEDRHTGLPSAVCTDQQLVVGRNAGHRAWTYDANNNRASQTLALQPRQTITLYQYDDANELAGTSTSGFPGFGTTITNLFPPGFGTTTINSYAYDRDGNLTGRSDGLSLEYVAASELESISKLQVVRQRRNPRRAAKPGTHDLRDTPPPGRTSRHDSPSSTGRWLRTPDRDQPARTPGRRPGRGDRWFGTPDTPRGRPLDSTAMSSRSRGLGRRHYSVTERAAPRRPAATQEGSPD
jgi:YD repeat-containing protein